MLCPGLDLTASFSILSFACLVLGLSVSGDPEEDPCSWVIGHAATGEWGPPLPAYTLAPSVAWIVQVQSGGGQGFELQ